MPLVPETTLLLYRPGFSAICLNTARCTGVFVLRPASITPRIISVRALPLASASANSSKRLNDEMPDPPTMITRIGSPQTVSFFYRHHPLSASRRILLRGSWYPAGVSLPFLCRSVEFHFLPTCLETQESEG